MNDNNLVGIHTREPTEFKALSAKGGKNSGKARRRKRDLRKLLEQVLSASITDEAARAELQALGIDETQGGLMLLKAVHEAGENPAMLRTIVELAGYTLTRQEVKQTVKGEPAVHIYLPDNGRDSKHE